MHINCDFCEILYNVCKDLRDQLEIEAMIAKRGRTSSIAKDSKSIIITANKILSLYEEDKSKNGSA